MGLPTFSLSPQLERPSTALPPLFADSLPSNFHTRVATAPDAAKVAWRTPRDLPEVQRAGTAPHGKGSLMRNTPRGRNSKSPRRLPAAVNRDDTCSPQSPISDSRTTPTWPPSVRSFRPQTASPQLEVLDEDWSYEESSGSKARKAVQSWWAPVDQCMRMKNPEKLEAALKGAHGATYLRAVHTVRRSVSLDPEDRHSIEMEMAARLVKARAVLGKWKGLLDEIKKAHKDREVDNLSTALSRWNLVEDIEDVINAREDLARWQDMVKAIPLVIKDAIQRKDIQKLRKVIAETKAEGPAFVESIDAAQKLIERYTIQARVLDNAVAEGKSASIQASLDSWEFSRDDTHAVQARAALVRREQQKQTLRQGVRDRQAPALLLAVHRWTFDANDEDLVAAKAMLQRRDAAAAELDRLMAPPADLQQLGNALQLWQFSEDDPAVIRATKCLDEHEQAAKAALDAKDGWTLHRVWAGGGMKAIAGSKPKLSKNMSLANTLRWRATATVQRYVEAAREIRDALDEAEAEAENGLQAALQDSMSQEDDFEEESDEDVQTPKLMQINYSPPAHSKLQKLVANWNFSQDDPHVRQASLWLRTRHGAKVCLIRQLGLAVEGGNHEAICAALKRAEAFTAASKAQFLLQPQQIIAAKEICVDVYAAVHSIGTLTFGIEPEEILHVCAKAKELTTQANMVRDAISRVEVNRFAPLKAVSKPPRTVHNVLELVAHAVAGLNPSVRNPPRDTEWRSCQRMIQNPKLLIANLQSLPDKITSGQEASVIRASQLHDELREEWGGEFCVESISRKSLVAGQLLEVMQKLFGYLRLFRENEGFNGSIFSFGEGSSMLHMSVTSKTSMQLKAVLLEVEGQRSAQPELSEVPRALCILQRARSSLGGSSILAAAWMVVGGEHSEHKEGGLAACLEKSYLHSVSTRAIALVSQQAVNCFCRKTQTVKVLPTKSRRSYEERRSCDDSGKQPPTLASRLEAAISCLNSCQAGDLESFGRTGRPVAEPAAMLLFGPAAPISSIGEDGSPCDGETLQAKLLEILRAVQEVLKTHSLNSLQQSYSAEENDIWSLHPVSTSMELTTASVKSYIVPQANLAAAQRAQVDSMSTQPLFARSHTEGVRTKSKANPQAAQSMSFLRRSRSRLSGKTGAQASKLFLEVMEAYYFEFLPQRAYASAAARASAEADSSYRKTQQVVSFAKELRNMNVFPDCPDADSLGKACSIAADQLVVLASEGISLAACHVEYMRRALDSAGSALLGQLPPMDPLSRLRWSEAAMSCQLVPLQHLGSALTRIAQLLQPQHLLALHDSTFAPGGVCHSGSIGAERLFAALAWVVLPTCTCDLSWEDAKMMLRDGDGFTNLPNRLVDWQILRDLDVSRMARAREILVEVWTWAADGCSGYQALQVIYSWLSLAVTLVPLATMGQRLQSVHRVFNQGLARVETAPAEQKTADAGKAWTAGLFLLDSRAEAWWWLSLIRTASEANRPWIEGEDGTLEVASPTEDAYIQNDEQPERNQDSPVEIGQEEDGLDQEENSSMGKDDSSVSVGLPRNSSTYLHLEVSSSVPFLEGA